MKNWRSETQRCLIIKTKALGETDKMVVGVSQERGRFVCIAKGARKMNSSKRACLESGNLVQIYLVSNGQNGGWPILTQAKMIADCGEIRSELKKIKQLMQFLEVLDRVLVEEELDLRMMNGIERIREMIVSNNYSGQQIKAQLNELMSWLGFGQENEPERTRGVLNYVAELTNQKMKSYHYLTVK